MSPQQKHSMEHRPKDLPFLHELLNTNQPRENFEKIAERAIKKELLTTRSREIAKTVGFDGTMSDNEKEQLAKDFEYARKTGCEDEFVAAINEKLKNADKPFRIVVDKRQSSEIVELDRLLKGETRTVFVVNADQGKIIDTHRFDVRHPLFIPSNTDQIPYDRPIEPFKIKTPPLKQK